MERPECCYRTCLSVQLNGRKLDDFSELESIEELQEGAVVELVEGACVGVHVCQLCLCVCVCVFMCVYVCTCGQ